eukprot:354616-Chlamydomonas_euryale.AAC.2
MHWVWISTAHGRWPCGPENCTMLRQAVQHGAGLPDSTFTWGKYPLTGPRCELLRPKRPIRPLMAHAKSSQTTSQKAPLCRHSSPTQRWFCEVTTYKIATWSGQRFREKFSQMCRSTRYRAIKALMGIVQDINDGSGPTSEDNAIRRIVLWHRQRAAVVPPFS